MSQLVFTRGKARRYAGSNRFHAYQVNPDFALARMPKHTLRYLFWADALSAARRVFSQTGTPTEIFAINGKGEKRCVLSVPVDDEGARTDATLPKGCDR